tara:strand:+ start:665 stop:1087 length:423 start_codon:yes stop_codon:yes gene_type:complete
LRLVASEDINVTLLGDLSLGYLHLVRHLHTGESYVCRTGKAEGDCLGNALAALSFGLGCLPFVGRYLCALGISLNLVGLSDAFLFGLLHAPKGLLLGLLLQEDVPAHDCPATCLLCCCLLQCHRFDVTSDTHLGAFRLSS